MNCRNKANPTADKRRLSESRAGGFTLIEVIISLFILMFGLLAVAKMQIQAMQGNVSAMQATEKTVVAQNFVDRLMALNYYQDVDDPDDPDDPLSEGTHEAPAEDIPDGITSVQWTVDEDPDGGNASTKRITVVVTPDRGQPVRVTTVKPGALDSDGDGVPDTRDGCPNSPSSQHSNPNGCSSH